MRWMLRLSLLLNVVVLTPVCIGLLIGASWTSESFGPSTAARGILLSIYLAIGLASILLLFVRDPKPVAAILVVQVLYKLTTPVTVGDFANPVVLSNLGIAAFHAVTLLFIWHEVGRPARSA